MKEGKSTQVAEERIEKLNSVRFEWTLKQTRQWKKRLVDLRDFYDENGAVPIPQAKHPSLYNWTWNQKKERDKFVRGEKTNMNEHRTEGLESVRFFEVFDN